ncbi:MAG TPA: DNA primase, partial [Opitutaceae bacterium]|nr:DNA primase [Opitutaceae bacterium]
MPAIKPTCVRDLKNRVNLSDVVSRVATLKKVGARWRALCPFHAEKSPSFYVDADKGFYKCFGCGKAGDIISFVRETEQLTFTEAVEALGQRFGVPIEYEAGAGPSREERSLRQELFDLHEAAAEFFREVFLAPGATGDFMRAYWVEKRRFPLELADEFKIGAAAPDDTGLGARLLKKKFSEDALRQSGLFFVRDGALLTLTSLRPRFRGRLMIPIRDHQGRVVAFTARQTDLTPADDPAREAKYINSPETPIFTKGNLLFNLDRARSHAGENKPFVLVEGQLDAMRCWHVGLKTAVAPQGTAITDSQLALLRRYTPQVECFFDGDSAGQKAALRFLPMALRAGLEIKFLGLAGAEKTDPDVLFLERGLAAYDELRRDSLNAMAFACRALLPSPATASSEEKARATQTIFELVAAAESEVARAGFLSEIAEYLHLPRSALQKDFDAFRRRGTRLAAPAAPPEATPPPAADGPSSEHDLLLLCLHFEHLGKSLAQALPPEWIDTTRVAGVLLQRCLAEFAQDTWPGRDHLDELLETPEQKTLAASLLFDNPTIDTPAKVAAEGLRQLRARALEPELRKIELALTSPSTESGIDPFSLIKRRSELQRQLRQ